VETRKTPAELGRYIKENWKNSIWFHQTKMIYGGKKI
jgi:hypothetical protein